MTTREKNPTLQRLDALVGTWETSVIVGEQTLAGGRSVFSWLDGDGILQQQATAEVDDSVPPEWVANSPMPVATAMGLDDRTGAFFMLYADARGVCRVYEMSLDDGVWTIWGQAGPTFYQRFEGRFSTDGRTIEAFWDGSKDGSTWERDFDMRYSRIS